MRISDNMMVFQQLNLNQAEGKKAPDKLQPGQILNAIVAEVLEEGLLLNLGGQLIRASVKDPKQYQANESVRLMVTEQSDQQITVTRLVDGAEGFAAKDLKLPVSEILKALKLPDTIKNQASVEALVAHKLPVSEGAIKQLLQLNTALDTLKSLPKAVLQAVIQTPEQLEIPIKTVVAQVLQEQGTGEGKVQAALANEGQKPIAEGAAPVKLPPQATGEQKLPLEAQVALKDQTSKAKPIAGAPMEQTPAPAVASQTQPVTTSPVSTEKTTGQLLSDPKIEVVLKTLLGEEATPETLKQQLKSLAFMMKADLPVDLKTLFALKQIFKTSPLAEAFDRLVAIASEQGETVDPSTGKSLIKAALDLFSSDVFRSKDGLNVFVKELSEAVEQLEARVESSKGDRKLQEAIFGQQSTQDSFKAPNLPFLVTQLPMVFQDELKTVTLYVEKRPGGKDVDPDDARLYISLNTHRLGTVGAMVEVKKKSIVVSMDTQVAETLAFIEPHLDELKTSVEALGFEVITHIRLKDDPQALEALQASFEAVAFTHFDWKV